MIFALIETSSIEKISIDTTAPQLVSVEMDDAAENSLGTGQNVTITVLSEPIWKKPLYSSKKEFTSWKKTSVSRKIRSFSHHARNRRCLYSRRSSLWILWAMKYNIGIN